MLKNKCEGEKKSVTKEKKKENKCDRKRKKKKRTGETGIAE